VAAAFFNPAYGFACLGSLVWSSSSTFKYQLSVDHSSQPNLCLLYGTIVMTSGIGYATVTLYPLQSSTPAFSANLLAWV
jgi:hypothetical protein